MLFQFSISFCAAMLAITSPMLHYWEHSGAVVEQATTDCCGDSSDAPNDREVPRDWQWKCLCFTRVAVTDGPPCDIAELAAKHLPGDWSLAVFDVVEFSTDPLSAGLFHWPVHFSPLVDTGDLCARLGRYLF